ncbi:MAG: hypothetical protein ACE5FA_09595 [Dehalococcoidia bacterium]
MKKLIVPACNVAALALFGACSSGNNGGAAVGLSVPEQVTLVEANGSTAPLRKRGLQDERLAAANLTDYQADQTRLWVHDDSMEALDTVNMILSSMKQCQFWDSSVLNKGPYVALVADETRGAEQGGQGRSGSATEYERFIVDSVRADGSSPHVVTFWIEGTSEGMNSKQPAIIYGRMTVFESPSATLPYGRFTLQFKQLLSTQAHDDPNVEFRGYLKAVPRTDGLAEFAFFNVKGDVTGMLNPGEDAFRMRARVVGQPDGVSGRAYSETRFSFNQGSGTQQNGSEYFLQFNANYMARKKVSGTTATEVFDRNNFTTQVYRYGVYDATTEARIDRLSGFGLETQGGVHGWAGYYGLWFPEQVTLTDGQKLIRRSYDPAVADQTYTAVVVPGRLEKQTRSTSSLGNLVNEDMETFDMSLGTEIMVQWTGTDLVKVATRSQQGWTRLQTPVSVSGNYSANEWLNFYSPSRGSVNLEMPGGGLANSTPVYIWTHETITGDSTELSGGNLTLYGYSQMLKANITQDQANFANSQSPYYPDAAIVSQGKTYVMSATSLVLQLAGNPVVLGSGVTVTSGPGLNGFHCGPLFTSPLASLAQMSSQTTTYDWSVGSNSWNQLRTVKDNNGNFVAFDPPLRFDYTHNEPANTNYNGKRFVLEWDGADLHGLPYLEDQTSQRWYPAFNIPTGTTLTNASGTYKVKALEGEQSMVSVSNPSAVIQSEGFDLSNTLTAPADEYVDPAIGPMPTVTSAPVFVGGVRQGQ